MFSLTKPSTKQIKQFVSELANMLYSYAEVGTTATDVPNGYTTDHNRILLGTGEVIWDRAIEAIRRWEMFNLGWTQVCRPDTPISVGADVAVLIHHLGFYSLNGSRIVYVVDEESTGIRRYGFAYGTLTAHAESGEERFMVEWHKRDDSVFYDLLAFSQPAHLLSKLGYPVARMLQKRFATQSLATMKRWCETG